jgi:hypothetical protein
MANSHLEKGVPWRFDTDWPANAAAPEPAAAPRAKSLHLLVSLGVGCMVAFPLVQKPLRARRASRPRTGSTDNGLRASQRPVSKYGLNYAQ